MPAGHHHADDTGISDAGSPAQIEVSNPIRVKHLDGWRGIAILLVLAGHFLHIPIVDTGKLGVELFFALSGRLMAQILFIQPMPLGQFYLRRVARVYPALLAMVITCALILAHSPLAIGPKYAVAASLLVYNYAAALGYRAGTIDHIWSLCIEEHAYLAMGIIAVLTARRRKLALCLLFAFCMLAMLNGLISTQILGQNWYQAYWRSDVHIASILLPAALLLGRHLYPQWWAPRVWMIPVLLIMGAACFSGDLIHPPFWTGTLGTAGIAYAVVWLDRGPQWLMRALSWPWLTAIGVLSYSLYLWQQPFFIYSHRKSWDLRIVSLAGTAVMGVISYYAVERPARFWINQRYGRWLAQRRAMRPAITGNG